MYLIKPSVRKSLCLISNVIDQQEKIRENFVMKFVIVSYANQLNRGYDFYISVMVLL